MWQGILDVQFLKICGGKCILYKMHHLKHNPKPVAYCGTKTQNQVRPYVMLSLHPLWLLSQGHPGC